MTGDRPQQIREFLLEQLPEHPKNSVTLAMQRFGVSRPAVHRHLNKLIHDGQVLKTGRTSGASYYLASAFDKELNFKIQPGLSEHDVWMEYLQPGFKKFPENIQEICNYGFTEIFNNAIDHSEGTQIEVTTNLYKDHIIIEIKDNGIGIFKKIKSFLKLNSERESILHLAKGKFSTDPENHSGEGIYFTSRAVDEFFIWSYDLDYLRNNREEDWFFESRENIFSGTAISLTVDLKTDKSLIKVLKEYTTMDEEEGFRKFDKTHFLVDLAKLGDERFISRSQAKRILTGLEKFNEVILDFNKVATVGQGFVDEVFRVFQNKQPHIKITYTNANEDVEFMIKRSIPLENPK